jgi:hypothetical protein
MNQHIGRYKRVLSAFLICVLLEALSCGPARAAFQESLWGARPTGLGGAFTALADDANAPAYNPAGITQIEHNELTVMYAQLFTGLTLFAGDSGETSTLSLGYFSYVPDIKRLNSHIGSFGISWSNFSATHVSQENTFTLTWARQAPFLQIGRSEVFTGVNINYLQHSFVLDSQTQGAVDPVFSNGSSAGALGFDLGLLARPNMPVLPGLKLGLAVKNINEPNVGLASVDRVPREYRFGLAYQDESLPYFTPTFDLWSRSSVTTALGGWEGWFMKNTVGLRAGANSNEFGGGLSLQYPLLGMNLRLDYSVLAPFLVQGSNGSHRISLTVDF